MCVSPRRLPGADEILGWNVCVTAMYNGSQVLIFFLLNKKPLEQLTSTEMVLPHEYGPLNMGEIEIGPANIYNYLHIQNCYQN